MGPGSFSPGPLLFDTPWMSPIVDSGLVTTSTPASATGILGVRLIERPPVPDARGWFRDAIRLTDLGMSSIESARPSQVSVSHSKAGVVRGIHYSVTGPRGAFWQSVTCVHGRVRDVLVDLRTGSPTFGHVSTTTLSAEAGITLVMPPGVGHGFQALEDESTLVYTMSVAYPEAVTRGIRPDFAPAALWNPADPGAIVSARDRSSPTFGQALSEGLLPTWSNQDVGHGLDR